MNKFIYWIKNILFFLYLYAYIKLVPNIYEVGVIGICFLLVGIFYILTMFYFYMKKDEKLNNNIPQNLLTIILYLYVFLVSYKYGTLSYLDDFAYLRYFQVNYFIIIISTFVLSINNFLIKE